MAERSKRCSMSDIAEKSEAIPDEHRDPYRDLLTIRKIAGSCRVHSDTLSPCRGHRLMHRRDGLLTGNRAPGRRSVTNGSLHIWRAELGSARCLPETRNMSRNTGTSTREAIGASANEVGWAVLQDPQLSQPRSRQRSRPGCGNARRARQEY